jgi:hypothetical protein
MNCLVEMDGLENPLKYMVVCVFQVTELLLHHGADPNIKNNQGQTALHLAAMYGHEEVVRLLL